jgi:flavin reductase (DIM6/NTAB) family NADH-FMN oxidoreductase RutF
MKKKISPRPWFFPRPVLLVTTRDLHGRDNIITVSWAGVASTKPPMVTVSLRKSRHSHAVMVATKEFVVNIPTSKHVDEVEMCGTRSGKEIDKFAASGFTKEDASIVAAPLIAQCPINLECRVRQVVPLGSHDLFVAEVVQTHADHALLGEDGQLNVHELDCLAWGDGDFLRVLKKTGATARSRQIL